MRLVKHDPYALHVTYTDTQPLSDWTDFLWEPMSQEQETTLE